MTDLVLHAAAVSYAQHGWAVFPLTRSKAPLFRSPHDGPGCKGECGQPGHGFYDAVTDPDIVSRWWLQHPTALIGGRVHQHLLVLDIDPYGGGDDKLTELEDTYGALPATLTCYSGRGDGGRHLYFQRPATPGFRLSGNRLRGGIDLIHHTLRYVVLPPSPHPKTGRPYWWQDSTIPPAQPPGWLTALLTPPPRQTLPYRQQASGVGSVAGLVSHVLRKGPKERTGRQDTVLWALCRAYEQGAPEAQIEAICQAAESIGKPRPEVDAMRDFAAHEYGSAAS